MDSDHGRFTDRARRVFALAEDEARGLNHKRSGTEHLLLGLLREGDGLAARVLTSMGVQLPTARSTVEYILGRGDSAVSGSMQWSPRARKVIGLSVEEARHLDHPYVGTEHLLLGIVREGQGIPAGQGKGIAAGVLETLGLSLSSVQREVLQGMGIDTSGNDGTSAG